MQDYSIFLRLIYFYIYIALQFHRVMNFPVSQGQYEVGEPVMFELQV